MKRKTAIFSAFLITISGVTIAATTSLTSPTLITSTSTSTNSSTSTSTSTTTAKSMTFGGTAFIPDTTTDCGIGGIAGYGYDGNVLYSNGDCTAYLSVPLPAGTVVSSIQIGAFSDVSTCQIDARFATGNSSVTNVSTASATAGGGSQTVTLTGTTLRAATYMVRIDIDNPSAAPDCYVSSVTIKY